MDNQKFNIKDLLVFIIFGVEFIFLEGIVNWASSVRPNYGVIVQFLVSLVGLILVVYLKSDFLRENFNIFKNNLWRNIILSIATGIGLALIVMIVRYFSNTIIEKYLLDSINSNDSGNLSYGYLILSLVPASLVPVTEEIIFRYELSYRFREKKSIYIIMTIVSAILFGLIHYKNYNGNLMLVLPLIISGLFLSIVYSFSKNIWVPILGHILYNFFSTLGIVLILLLGQLFI